MSVLVDSPIWSLAFRRKTASGPYFETWSQLVRRGEARIIGPVRQEVLSGIRERSQFERLRERLNAFPDVVLTQNHFERAAEFHNVCRSRGVQGSPTDFLLCAVADSVRIPIFTTDADFTHFARHLSIELYPVEQG